MSGLLLHIGNTIQGLARKIIVAITKLTCDSSIITCDQTQI
jgi:hypothetical protein